jgi:signal transduction histidine kinase
LVVGGCELSRADRAVLDRLARQAAVAVHSVLLARDVARARAAAATAREEERRRLRRDLHDGMGPALAALALQAETARDLLEVDPAAAGRLLDRLVPRLNEAVADVRVLVHDLRPPTLDELGLVGALEELANRFSRPGAPVRLRADALPVLPAAVDLAAYRIASEALNNAARHAGAATVELAVAVRDDALHLDVVDDGRGLTSAGPPGVGLRSMRERAEELGGVLQVGDRAPLPGTHVSAVLPLQRVIPLPQQREAVPA